MKKTSKRVFRACSALVLSGNRSALMAEVPAFAPNTPQANQTAAAQNGSAAVGDITVTAQMWAARLGAIL
jgi:hypothetical protein